MMIAGPDRSSADREAVVHELKTRVQEAAKSWETDASSPECDEVLQGFLDYLAANRLATIYR